jgi:hypothetical protein
MNNNLLNKFRIFLFLYFLCLYIITIQGIQSGDNTLHYHRTQNILKNNSLSMPEGKYDFKKQPWLINWMKEGKEGRIYLTLPDGLSIASVPLTFFGNLIEKTSYYGEYREKMNKAWKNGKPEKEIYYLNKLPSAFFSVMINPIVIALTVLIFFNFCYLLSNSLNKAFISSILLGNATILWVYSSNFWTQPIVTFGMFAAFYFLFRFKNESNIKFLLLGGLFAGYSYITRYASAISLPFFIFYIGSSNWDKKNKIVKHLAVFSIPLFLFFFLQMYWNYYRFGSPFDFGVYKLPFLLKCFIPHSTSMLFSLSRSIFVFSPPLILAPFGMKKLVEQQKIEVVNILGISFVFLIFYSLFGFGISFIGSAWGPRYLVTITPFLLLPVCFFLRKTLWKKIFIYTILVIGLFIQLVAVLQPFRLEAINMYFGDNRYSFYSPFLKTEIIPQAKMLFKEGIDLWMFESIPKLIVGIVLLAICFISLWYCIRRTYK